MVKSSALLSICIETCDYFVINTFPMEFNENRVTMLLKIIDFWYTS